MAGQVGLAVRRRFFTPDEKANLTEEAAKLEEAAAGQERDFFYEVVAKARPDMADELADLLTKKNWRGSPFARLKRANLNNPDDEDALPDFATATYQPKPYPHGETQQPAGQYVTITEIEIFVKPTLLPNTFDALIEQHGVRVHYHDGRPPLEMPLRDVLGVARYTPDAGVDNETHPDESPVAGTQTILQPTVKTIRLLERDAWVIKPGDSDHKLEFFRYPEYGSAPALTGETADLFFYIIYRGMQYRAGKGKS